MSGIALDETITSQVNNALADKCPVLVAYVDDDGQPRVSYRGSTHVHGPDQLAIWVRDPNGGMLANVGQHPRVTLLYRNFPYTYTFYGRARIDDDPATRDRVFEESAPAERDRDPERAGRAVVVDLDAVVGGSPDHRVDLRR